VRDNPARAAAIGFAPRRVRWTMLLVAAFFAGIAGVLSLINVELVSSESVGLTRSTSALVATVIGGAGSFFGPVIGAVLLTFFSTAVASVSAAWPMYLGLFFVWVVVAAPEGIAGWPKRDARALCFDALGAFAWSVAAVTIVETLYARQSDTNTWPRGAWIIAIPCVLLALLLARHTRNRR
jgi:branched-chain amino acid transport system permease protein